MAFTLRTITGLQLVSLLLTVVMLAGTVTGMHPDAFAADQQQAAACCHASDPDGHASDSAPAFPADQHDEADGCSSCLNCACHAPLAVQPLRPGYRPLVSHLRPLEPFTALPEVYLTKFVPPQLHA